MKRVQQWVEATEENIKQMPLLDRYRTETIMLKIDNHQYTLFGYLEVGGQWRVGNFKDFKVTHIKI